MAAWLGLLLIVQTETVATTAAGPASQVHFTTTAVRATLAAEPPELDGSDTDAVWRSAPVIDGFQQAKPSEGAEARYRTEARVAYDARTLYVFVRAYDPRPDSIVGLLSRRDEQTASDQIMVMLDPYHDRRTGFEFVVNPAGVKTDYAVYNDGDEDVAWDAVWEAATAVDSLGWTAEYRIPLSQLHYASRNPTFGILVWRTIQRHNEDVTWPLFRQSRSGLVSQFGELTGLDGLASPGHAELTPYLVTKSVPGTAAEGYDRDEEVSAGGDLKYRLASNLLLNATVNPDFGQVEADPSELNLGAFETFFDEKRPFFVEGKGTFEFTVNCVVVVDCDTGEGLFYSRRIGRAPQLARTYGDESSATSTRILGAAKITGRLPGGFSLGVLDAVTDNVAGPTGTTLEPTTNYAVVSGNQDLEGGATSLGFIATAVNRDLDLSSEPYLHRAAYSAGVGARRRFAGRRYEVSGSFDLSRVSGTAEAIARTQRDPVHLYQRPDGPLRFDPTRTALDGSNVELRFAKVGGDRLRFETAYQRRTPGFEVNDLGFLLQADQEMWTTWATLMWRKPNRIFRELRWNFNNWEHWSVAGLPTERAFNTNVHTRFNNRWWLHAGGTLGQIGATYCDRCARGGPAIRQDAYIAPWIGIEGDDRRPLIPYFWVNYNRADGGRSERLSLEPELELKVSTRFTTNLSARWERNRNDVQYYDTFTDELGVEHYAFAHLSQRTLSFTWRLGYTFTPNTSLQVYASPFISKGTYSDLREVADARASDYDARYRPYDNAEVNGDPGGFNVREFRSNVVFRWEYRPGSTLFLVWSQGRAGSSEREGAKSFGGDLGDLFRERANHTFLVKVSYWLAR